MKKIIMSVLAIALAVGVVSSAAYALFTDTVNVAGITMTSGNADLVVRDTGTNWLVSGGDFVYFLNQRLNNFYPGKVDYTNMIFTNESKSDIGLKLSVQITAAGGNWNQLYNKIEMAIGTDANNSNNLPTAWADLDYWASAPRSISNDILDKNQEKEYRIFLRVKSNVGNEVIGQSLDGMTITFTGTQAN